MKLIYKPVILQQLRDMCMWNSDDVCELLLMSSDPKAPEEVKATRLRTVPQ